MIGLSLVKRLGQGFKIVCLLLTLIFFVGCAGTDPNGNNGGNNGDTGNGDTTYYYLPTQGTTVENTKPTIEPSPTTDFAPTSYLYENGNVWYGSTTPSNQIHTKINNDGVEIADHHYIGTSVNIIGYGNGDGKWYEQTTAIPPPPIEDGLDDISLTSPEGSKYQDYIDEAVAKGVAPWVIDRNGYSGPGAEGLSLQLVGRNNGVLGFDIAQKTFTTDGQMLLFKSTQNPAKFTFGLLLVKDGSETRGKFIPNASYRRQNQSVGTSLIEAPGGDGYLIIDTGFTGETLTSLKDCKIFMIVTRYEGIPSTSPALYKNIIEIK